jgi:hypothetical protein
MVDEMVEQTSLPAITVAYQDELEDVIIGFAIAIIHYINGLQVGGSRVERRYHLS